MFKCRYSDVCGDNRHEDEPQPAKRGRVSVGPCEAHIGLHSGLEFALLEARQPRLAEGRGRAGALLGAPCFLLQTPVCKLSCRVFCTDTFSETLRVHNYVRVCS